MNLNELSTIELINTYSKIIEILKDRNVIRTKNFIGDIGEFLAVEYFNNNVNKSNLQFAPPGTKNIDAISRDGDRYSIKSTSSNLTGVFYGLADPDGNFEVSDKINIKDVLFEHLIIVFLSHNYKLNKIIELDWRQFLKYKKWHSRMKAWNVGINNNLTNESKVIYDRFV